MSWIFVLLIPTIVHAGPSSDCGESPLAFRTWYLDGIKRISSLNHLNRLANDVGICKPVNAETKEFVEKCTKPIKEIEKVSRDNSLPIALKKETREVSELPPALFEPNLIRNLNASYPDKKELEQAIKSLVKALPKGAKVFQFPSAILDGRSIVIVLPSEKQDIFIHTVEDSNSTYNVIVAKKQNADGTLLSPPKMDFLEVDGSTRRGRNATRECTTCHRSGTIAILPRNGEFISHTPGMSGEDIKKWWNTNRLIDMEKKDVFPTEALAPPIGPERLATRTDDFVRQCAQREVPNITTDRVVKIRENMNCVGCHQYGRPEVLRFPTHPTKFALDVLRNVIYSGHMPLGSDKKESSLYLNEKERRALFTCLLAEYFGGILDKEISQGNERDGIFLNYLSGACELDKENAKKQRRKTE